MNYDQVKKMTISTPELVPTSVLQDSVGGH